MLKRSQTRSPLQIFWEFLLYSQVISKSMRVADTILSRGTLSVSGLITLFIMG